MTWKTPKTDWTAADVPGPNDFNRIEENTLDNHERLNGHDSDIVNLNSRISANDSEIGKIKNGTTKVPNASNADKLLSGLRNVSVIMGTISNGNTLPLPSGFSASECFWIVSINSLNTFMHYSGETPTKSQCYVDASRTVYIRATRERSGQDPLIATGTANYLVIGVKK